MKNISMGGAGLDHIILHTGDIDAAVEAFTKHGFVVQTRADAKPAHGTASRFVVFEGGAYILLMQFTDPSRRKAHRLGELLETPAVLVDYGIAVSDSHAAERVARAAGLVPSAAEEHRNVLADGTPWCVRLFTLGRGAPTGNDAFPFVVSDLEPRSGRVPAYMPHPNGVVGLHAIHVEALEARQAATLLATVAGVEAVSKNEIHSVPLGHAAIVFHKRGAAAGRTEGNGGILSIDVIAQAVVPDMLCHGARIVVLSNPTDGSKTRHEFNCSDTTQTLGLTRIK